MQDYLEHIPRGKKDKPMLLTFGQPLIYNPDDIDGLYYMLDKDFSGCLVIPFSKEMDPNIIGKAKLDNEELPACILKKMKLMANSWVLGIPLRGYAREYGQSYQLSIEGFTDIDGNMMELQIFTVSCIDRVLPKSEDAVRESVALQVAEDGIVLLENKENILPLKSGVTLNLFGKGIHQFRTTAVGAGKINPRYTVKFLQAIQENSPFKLNHELVDFYRCDKDLIPEQSMIDDAKIQSDIAVMLITRAAGENLDSSTAKGEYYLTDDEDCLLAKLSKEFSKVIVILNIGYPIDVSFVKKYDIDALLYTGFGGMLAGQAIVNVLSGKVNPSGKLPDTWANDYFDIPSSRNFYDSVDKPVLDAECGVFLNTVYEEGLYVGYRYFTSFNQAPAYPFGYGLSYTNFSIETLDFTWDQGLSISVDVTNIGEYSGREVVQVYVSKPNITIESPLRELVGFKKTYQLGIGSCERLDFKIPLENFSVYDERQSAYIVQAGDYQLFLGNDVNAPFLGSFHVDTEIVIKQVTSLMRPLNVPRELNQANPISSFPKGNESGVIAGAKDFNEQSPRKHWTSQFLGRKPKQTVTYEDLKLGKVNVEDFVAQLSIEELARLAVCASHGWGMEGIGEAGRIFKLEGYDLPDFPVSDGNSGVNLRATNIGFPSCVTLASSFDLELAERCGKVIGQEAKLLDMPLILAPGMNLHRNPLNGRQPEYFSEDPLLAGMMAGFYCKGLEGEGVGSCIKHLAANNSESSRKRNQSIIGERTLRELYLKPFEIAMSIQMPATVMTAYNAMNGCPTAADEELIIGFLRHENNFEGFVMTDWGTYDSVDVAKMVQAGNSWITPGSNDTTFTKLIVEGVENGTIDLARLQENNVYLIKTLLKYR